MRLLIVTQTVDKKDPVLGFFHRWIVKFSEYCEKLLVICLKKGEFELPGVAVFSLGKEESASKLKYIFRFYRYIFEERNNYDAVFVHMNQEYVLLGAPLWKMWGKKVFMWRNHPNGSLLTDLAVLFSDKVFCTSKYSYTAKFGKTNIMPVGIDTDFFKREEKIQKIPRSILFLSRISPIKKPDLLIDALGLLKKEGVMFSASVVGTPLPKDEKYYAGIKDSAVRYGLSDRVNFRAGVTNEEAMVLYNKHEIYVNLTPSGSLDKTIFEAMFSGSLALVSNKSLVGEIDERLIFKENDALDLAQKLKYLLEMNDNDKKVLADRSSLFVEEKHSLKKLADMLFK